MNDEEPEKPDLVFYYNREERLKRAPERVRRAYSGEETGPKRGIVRIFFSNRGTSAMFMAILFVAAATLFYGYLGKSPGETTIDGVKANLSAFAFEDEVYVTIKMRQSSDVTPRSVMITIGGIGADGIEVVSRDIDAVYDGEEQIFRITLNDYDILKVIVSVEMAGETRSMTKTVDR